MANLTEEFNLVDPRYDTSGDEVSLAKPIENFEGLRLGLLDNRKDNVDILLEGIAEAFQEQFDIADVTTIGKFIFSMPAEDAEIATLVERSDFVVTAIAD